MTQEVEKKLKAVIYYVCMKCAKEKHTLGTTKLAKILWFSDTYYYKKTGVSITGIDNYHKFDFGPFRADFYPILSDLVKDSLISGKESHVWGGKVYTIASEEYKGLKLSSSEKRAVDENIEVYGPLTAGELSEASHEEWWDFFENKEEIPVSMRSIEKSLPISETDIKEILSI